MSGGSVGALLRRGHEHESPARKRSRPAGSGVCVAERSPADNPRPLADIDRRGSGADRDVYRRHRSPPERELPSVPLQRRQGLRSSAVRSVQDGTQARFAPEYTIQRGQCRPCDPVDSSRITGTARPGEGQPVVGPDGWASTSLIHLTSRFVGHDGPGESEPHAISGVDEGHSSYAENPVNRRWRHSGNYSSLHLGQT